ncbi:MAG: hypothetical protein QOI89_3592 [Solirubrobacteraceae bacterium]|jgi:hypothetical protein|nr:hypothetical protein [Solirubrobacteraceae bacterium]
MEEITIVDVCASLGVIARIAWIAARRPTRRAIFSVAELIRFTYL